MKKATLINSSFSVEVLPTELRYCLQKDKYEGSVQVPNPESPNELLALPMNMVDISYEIYAGKWKKLVDVTSEEGEVSPQETWVDFGAPVLFDSGVRPIPFGLYLKIESYRDVPSVETLAEINEQIKMFPFENSLEGFELKVATVE